MRSVYLETTIPSHLAARPSGDLVTAAHQRITHDWWDMERTRFNLFISDVVVLEIGKGDLNAVERRQNIVEGIPSLPFNTDAQILSGIYARRIKRLKNARADAQHLAVASLNSIDYVLRWNCRHLVNMEVVEEFRIVNQEFGISIPQICTPEEL